MGDILSLSLRSLEDVDAEGRRGCICVMAGHSALAYVKVAGWV